MEGLLNENQVVDAIAAFLASEGYTIEQKLHGHQRGVDLIARRTEEPARLIHVEAKGGTSTRVGSAKYGKPMSGGEVRINVAEALYTAAVVSTRDRTPDEDALVSAVAFHDDARHRKHVDPLSQCVRPAQHRRLLGRFIGIRGPRCAVEPLMTPVVRSADRSAATLVSPSSPAQSISHRR